MSTKINMAFDKDKLEELSYHISDLLCWLIGFDAGISTAKDTCTDYNPMRFIRPAIEDLRSFNIDIKEELRKSDKGEI